MKTVDLVSEIVWMTNFSDFGPGIPGLPPSIPGRAIPFMAGFSESKRSIASMGT
jgi:hypothetical protein